MSRGAGVAGLVVVLAAAGAGIGAWVASSRSGEAPPATTAAPAPVTLHVIFPEGFTRAEMAARVAAVREIAIRTRHVTPLLTGQSYLAASAAARPPLGFRRDAKGHIEGFLFPATYEFLARTTSRELVAAQLAAFRRIWSTVDLSYARSRNLTPYDVLIIASMVEKEAQVPSERPKIAAVIYNRLRAHMPLGIDATIRYGLHVPPTRSLTTSDLASDNPYNTRKLLGLPPTPIANPGLAAIQAAAHPARVDYLYFLRKPDRRHHYFTRSFDDFIAHEKAYGY